MVLAWRNRPEVRSAMLTQHEIRLDEHRQWFEHASLDPTRCLLIAEEAGQPLGYVHFSGVAAGGVSAWGFYTAAGAPPGSGSRLGRAALDHAFNVRGVRKVCAQVLATNVASLRFHRKLGFVEEGALREQQQIEDTYYDLICFGLLRREWRGLTE
jgi:UDP-4-amino-4,6-dideoxy-N-acetyl-beta-L-altrosamine N-acetyltransferase